MGQELLTTRFELCFSHRDLLLLQEAVGLSIRDKAILALKARERLLPVDVEEIDFVVVGFLALDEAATRHFQRLATCLSLVLLSVGLGTAVSTFVACGRRETNSGAA
jgi:hypothetical protein